MVTGATGQLAQSLFKISKNFECYDFKFYNKYDLDISDFKSVNRVIRDLKPTIIINCAAYTNVELAEIKKGKANLINCLSVGNISEICAKNKIKLIHISTDYVFDGHSNRQYKENDNTNPINYYGTSKLNGEKLFLNLNPPNSIIVRTSWLYSAQKNNFVGKILYNLRNKDSFQVVNDEISSPTNSYDLANFILKVIPKLNEIETGIYNYSNSGYCTRFEFSKLIKFLVNGESIINKCITTEDNIIKRPKFSSLDLTKTKHVFDAEFIDWKESLERFFKIYNYGL